MHIPPVPNSLEQDEIDQRLPWLTVEQANTAIDLKRLRNSLSPISQLPPELLAKIFLSYALPESERHIQSDRPALRRQFRLSAVCHGWRTTAMGCTELWSIIQVRKTTDPQLLEFHWAITGEAPVRLVVNLFDDPPSSLVEDTVSRMHNAADRLQSLALYIEKGNFRTFFGGVVPLRFSILEDLTIYSNISTSTAAYYGLLLADVQAPRLHRLSAARVAIPWNAPILRSPFLVKLNCTHEEESGDFFGFLKKADQLQELAISLSPQSLSGLGPLGPPVTLPHLTRLDLSAPTCAAITKMLANIRIGNGGWEKIYLYCEEDTLDARSFWGALGCALCGDLISPKEVFIDEWRGVRAWKHPTLPNTEVPHDMELVLNWRIVFQEIASFQGVWSFASIVTFKIYVDIPSELWEHLATTSSYLECIELGAVGTSEFLQWVTMGRTEEDEEASAVVPFRALCRLVVDGAPTIWATLRGDETSKPPRRTEFQQCKAAKHYILDIAAALGEREKLGGARLQCLHLKRIFWRGQSKVEGILRTVAHDVVWDVDVHRAANPWWEAEEISGDEFQSLIEKSPST